MDKIDELLTRGVANIIPGKEELKKALNNRKLNIYLGIDPTATKIHLGNAVPLRKLQKFAELGHNVTFLIGDFTALIGDTSDKDSERPVLTKEQIEENFKTYKKQAEKILDFSKVKVKYNSEWLSKLSFEEIVKLCQHFSVGDFVGRELIRERLRNNKKVALHEFLYPVMQGYDSYFMDTDLQIGGTDQTFNMQAGRILQKDLRSKQSFVLSNEFLEGTDGRKMSKTWNNAIWLDDNPNDQYANVMAVNDDLIIRYFVLATDLNQEKIDEIEKRLKDGVNPIDVKKELAFEIVSQLKGRDEAKKAQEHFEKTVQDKSEQEIKNVTVPLNSLSSLATVAVDIGIASSRSEAKRLFEQKGLRVNGELPKSLDDKVEPGTIITKGRENYKIEVNESR